VDELVEQLSGTTIMNWKSNLQKKRNQAPFSFWRLSFLLKTGMRLKEGDLNNVTKI